MFLSRWLRSPKNTRRTSRTRFRPSVEGLEDRERACGSNRLMQDHFLLPLPLVEQGHDPAHIFCDREPDDVLAIFPVLVQRIPFSMK